MWSASSTGAAVMPTSEEEGPRFIITTIIARTIAIVTAVSVTARSNLTLQSRARVAATTPITITSSCSCCCWSPAPSSTVSEHSPKRHAHVERRTEDDGARAGADIDETPGTREARRSTCTCTWSTLWESSVTFLVARCASRAAPSAISLPAALMRRISCCSFSSVSDGGRHASTLSPTLTMHLTTLLSAPSAFSISAIPTTGSTPGMHTLPQPDPSPSGPMYCPALTAPSTLIGTCPR
mmetsp:Transcript_24588/g.49838  ORF Transcript_24588/g.49838 Transcript_24588/m.49838 type:complete len:239 (+) Transcript_24588:389-1105(+)